MSAILFGCCVSQRCVKELCADPGASDKVILIHIRYECLSLKDRLPDQNRDSTASIM